MKILNIKIKDKINSTTIRDRLYNIDDKVTVEIYTNEGVIRCTALPGFETDGRSGGPLVDCIFPNWGTQMERAVVLVHDILYYDFDISWETANQLLRDTIKFIGKSCIRANLVYAGVNTEIAHKAFGAKTTADRHMKLYCNARWDAC